MKKKREFCCVSDFFCHCLYIANATNHKTNNIMKRIKMLTYCDNLRDVITIHELSDGSIIACSVDKITGKKSFMDDMDDECRKILENHLQTIICA